MNVVGAYDDLSMSGINHSWFLSSVRRDWQDEIRRLDPDLRVLHDPYLHQWALVFRVDGAVTDFADGFLVGWMLVTRFPLDMDIDGIVANVAAMADRNKFASPEALVEHYEGLAKADEEKHDRDFEDWTETTFKDVDKNIDVLNRDHFRTENAKKDNRYRAHAHTKLIVPGWLAGRDEGAAP